MKVITLFSCSLALVLPQLSFADHRVLVPGHQNPDGTYTAPYVTVVPDDSVTTTTNNNVVVTPQSSDVLLQQNTGTVVVNPNQVNAVEAGAVYGGALHEGYRGVNGAATHDAAAAVHSTSGQLQRGNLGEANRGFNGAGRENGLGRDGHLGGEHRR